jgi:FSR family fosmidomycin resistance protein-like MFS transporter
LGSGLFHPVGMINAAAAGGPYPATATSIFFLLGQSGLALGPIVAGFVLQSMNIEVGMPLMALGALPAVLVMAVYLSSPMMVASKGKAPARSAPTGQSNVARRALWVGIAFMLVITLRVTTSQSLVTLLPKYFADLGYQPALYGSMIGIFSLGGAIGTFVGGYLGDRYSRRNLLFVATLLSVPFSYGLLHTTGWLFWPLAFLAGALLNVPHSVLVVMAQEFLPKRQGMMGGAALGFTFASGAVMAWIASWFADLVGLAPVLSILAFVPIGAALSALALPAAQPRTIDDSSLSAPAAAD